MRILLLTIMTLITAACGTIATPLAAETPELPVDTALIERGIAVYRENYCGLCHTLTAANTRGTFGPNHDDTAAQAEQHMTLNSYNGEAITAAEYIRESLLNPAVFYTPGYEVTNHHMPPFTHLPDEDIDALVYLLLHQRLGEE